MDSSSGVNASDDFLWPARPPPDELVPDVPVPEKDVPSLC